MCTLPQAIDASVAFGFKDLVGFEGGRGFPAAMAKWSAWPKHLAPWVMALLALKWIPLLEYAADRGVTITFEIGHPENDILTGQNFRMFFNMLTLKARKGVGVNADWSHFLNIGIHPMPHMVAAASTGCRFTNHYKWGAVADRGQGDASMYGGWKDWSDASTTFFTFATVGPDSLAREFHEFNLGRAKAQGDKVLDVVYEGEDATIRNPKQAMMIGAENCRAAIDGKKKFIKVSGVVDNSARGFTLTHPEGGPTGSRVKIIGANRRLLKMERWDGGPFDAAFDSPLKPWELLEMNGPETSGCWLILRRAGFVEAAAIFTPSPASTPVFVPAVALQKEPTSASAAEPAPDPDDLAEFDPASEAKPPVHHESPLQAAVYEPPPASAASHGSATQDPPPLAEAPGAASQSPGPLTPELPVYSPDSVPPVIVAEPPPVGKDC